MSGGDGAALLVIDMLNPYVIPTDAVAAIPEVPGGRGECDYGNMNG